MNINMTEIPDNIKRVTVVQCVWCQKAMSLIEADEYGRCKFDSYYPFTENGKTNSILDRGLIAQWMALDGLAVP